MFDRVRQHEDRDDGDEEDRDFQIFGYETAREGPGQCFRCRIAEQSRQSRCEQHRRHDFDQRRAVCRQAEVFIGDHRAQRAGGIVDDRLPLQKRCWTRLNGRLAEQGHHDRRTCYDENAAKQNGDGPDQSRNLVRCHSAQKPPDSDADRGHTPDRAAHMAQLPEIEAEPPFEEDQCDPDGDHRFQQVAESMFGIEDTQDRPGKESRRQHQHDGRAIGAPGEPLGTDAQYAHHRDNDRLFLHYLDVCSLAAPACRCERPIVNARGAGSFRAQCPEKSIKASHSTPIAAKASAPPSSGRSITKAPRDTSAPALRSN